jgi:hypothetical protein
MFKTKDIDKYQVFLNKGEKILEQFRNRDTKENISKIKIEMQQFQKQNKSFISFSQANKEMQ